MDKQQLLDLCKAKLLEKKKVINEEIASITEAFNDEEKVPTGDKHETGRAMLHLEQEKFDNQYKEVMRQVELLDSIKVGNMPSEVVRKGSLAFTNSGVFFIAVSLGVMDVEGEKVFVISEQSPLGQLLVGKQAGEGFDFNGKAYSINKVL